MKKIISLLIVSLMILPLFGCHGSTNRTDFEAPESFDTTKNYEIVFWAKNDTNKRQVAVYENAAEEFQKLYPNIKVTIKFYTDYKRIYDDVITNIQTGTTPNICISYPDHIATYLTGNNVVVPLDDLLNQPSYGLGGKDLKFDSPTSTEIVSKYLEEGKLNNHYYALPYMRSTEALYINETYVNALGYEIPDVVTWDFVWEVSNAALEKNADGTYKVNNQNVLLPFIYKSTDNMMIQMLKQLDADYTNDNGDILLFNDTSKKIMYKINEETSKGTFQTFKNVSYPGNYFNAGQCIFAVDSTAGATWIGSDAPLSDIAEENKKDFKTVVRAIPQADVNNIKMISQGPSICLFNKEDPNEVIASWLFAQYLLTNDVQINYSKSEGYVPVTLKAQNSDIYKEYLANKGIDNDEHYDVKIDAVNLLLNNIDNTFVTPVFNGSANVREAAGQLIESAVKRAIAKNTFDDNFINQVFENCVSLYHLDQTGTSNTINMTDLGELPTLSKCLIGGIIITWIGIGIYYFIRKKNNKKS